MTTTSQHILNASANLLGFCLFVIASLRIANRIEAHSMDEFTALIAVVLTFSCIFAFVALRTAHQNLSRRCERIANYLFLASLLGLLLVIVFVTFTFID